MLAALLLLLLQSGSVTGSLTLPDGAGRMSTGQIALLPEEYAQAFNAEAQQRLDRYWEAYKPEFAQRKELFLQIAPLAYRDALDAVLFRMRRDSKIDLSRFVRQTSTGEFDFRGLPAGNYKLVATASIGNAQYAWMESIQVTSGTLFVQMKNHIP